MYCHSPLSVTSWASSAVATHRPSIVPAIRAGPIPPASIGFGIHAESPTRRYPPDTMQSFWRLTDTWNIPELLFSSSGSVDSLGFAIALFLFRYSDIRDSTLSRLPSLSFLLLSSDFSTPSPMFTLSSPFGKTQPYPPGAMSWSRCIMQ